jgi:RNA polymerase sigma-70 factor (ECF subfamily)
MNDMQRLIEPLIPSLRRYARALAKDRTVADDLVQDCLERAVSRWHQRRADGDVRSWMFTILHNLAISRFRQTVFRGKHLPLDDADDAALGQPASQEDQLNYSEVLDKVSQLPEEQRSVLLLVAVEELSYAEAARVLDIPIGTVMSRLSRGRERLLLLMEGDDDRVVPLNPNLRRVK